MDKNPSKLSNSQLAAQTRLNSVTRPSLTFRSSTFSSECKSDCTCEFCEQIDLAVLALLATAILYGRAASFDRTFLFHRRIFPFFKADNGVVRKGLSHAFFFLQEIDFSKGKNHEEDEKFMNVVRIARQRNRSLRWHDSSLAVGIGETGNRFGDDDKRALPFAELDPEQFSAFYDHVSEHPPAEIANENDTGFELTKKQFELAKNQFINIAPEMLSSVCEGLLKLEGDRNNRTSTTAETSSHTVDILNSVILDVSTRSLRDWLKTSYCRELTDFESTIFKAKENICLRICEQLYPNLCIQATTDRELQGQLDHYQLEVGIPTPDESENTDRIRVKLQDALSFLSTW